MNQSPRPQTPAPASIAEFRAHNAVRKISPEAVTLLTMLSLRWRRAGADLFADELEAVIAAALR